MRNPEIKALAKQLNYLSPKKQRVALESIRALPNEEAIKTIVELTQMPLFERIQVPVYTSLVMLALIVLLFAFILRVPFPPEFRHFIAPIAPALFIAAGWHISFSVGMKYLGEWVYPLLSEYKDARLIQPTLQAWGKNGLAKEIVGLALINNLPLLTPELAFTLTTPERQTLRNLVLSPAPELCLVVLETLPRIEDTLAILNIEQLLKSECNANVKEKAIACLEHLRAVRDLEKQSKMLLRPSQDTTNETVLLRVAKSVEAEDERQLLRPGSGKEE